MRRHLINVSRITLPEDKSSLLASSILKQKNTLALTRPQLQMGNLASVTSNIVCRFLMGLVCDKVGARKGLALVLSAMATHRTVSA